MSTDKDSLYKTLLPTFFAITFAILQGFTVYFTKNVENSLAKVETKLNQTWDITLVTQTKLASIEIQNVKLEADQTELAKGLRDVREELLRHVAETPHY